MRTIRFIFTADRKASSHEQGTYRKTEASSILSLNEHGRRFTEFRLELLCQWFEGGFEFQPFSSEHEVTGEFSGAVKTGQKNFSEEIYNAELCRGN